MTPQFFYSLLLVIVLGLSACQPSKPFSEPEADKSLESAAIAAERDGDFQTAARHYLRLAGHSQKQRQANYYLRAARNFWQAGNREEAWKALSHVDLQVLSRAQYADALVMKARIALANQQADKVLELLGPLNADNLLPRQQMAVLELRTQAYHLTGNLPEEVNNLIAMAPLLPEQAREQNQQQLWQLLMSMPPRSLELYNPAIPADIKSGWYELAYIIKTYQDKPEALDVALENWRRDYPGHPASPSLYQPYLTTGTRLPAQLPLIAVLLPETGRYQQAAAAIKQGIIAAHYAARSRTELRFYPVDAQNTPVDTQYQQAVADGASIVIGPLAKSSVKQLVSQTPLSIPVLALNRVSTQESADNLFQFGLAPEDDARAIADFANQQLFQRTVVLVPASHWGQRIFNAFQQQWLQHGGVILNHARYDSQQNDFSDTLKPLLGLDQSIQRKIRLQRTLGQKLEFEPRRRQDIDFIFLAAKPLKARQLVPQLKFHRTGKLPIMATSQAYSGQQNKQQNIDLNHLIITDIPWILAPERNKDPVYNALKQNQTPYFDHWVRLYALGADAYRLIPHLNRLSRRSEATFQGATGLLSIDNAGRINRKTRWGIFKDGLLVPLKEDAEK